MAIYVNTSGTWRTITRPYVNQSGTWRTINTQYVNQSGTWRTVFTSAAPPPTSPTTGALWMWGRNYRGQAGNNNTSNVFTPVTTFAGGTNWRPVACGYNHASSIKADGTLWVWGGNEVNQLGNITTNDSLTPITTFAGGTDWSKVACGVNHVAAIKTNGTLWTWGINANGQLGLNNSDYSKATPVTTFAGGTNWSQVDCCANYGDDYMAAIKTDGTLWIWGGNYFGELGNNNTTQRLTPVTTFAGGTNWSQVSCGSYHVAAIKTNGTLWTWGYNSYGQLGNNRTDYRIQTPITTFAGGTNWAQVGCGHMHTLAIKTDGTLWSWGYNYYAALGTNDSANSKLTPVTTFAGGTNWSQVAGGISHYSAAIKTNGTLWTWGYNYRGYLGNNNGNTSLTPITTFAGGTTWKQVDAGEVTGAIR